MKKFLGVLLSFSLLVTTIPMTVFAEETVTSDESTQVEELNNNSQSDSIMDEEVIEENTDTFDESTQTEEPNDNLQDNSTMNEEEIEENKDDPGEDMQAEEPVVESEETKDPVIQEIEKSDDLVQEEIAGKAEAKIQGIHVDLHTQEKFKTYTDPVTEVAPSELVVSIPVNINKADIENATIEIPYGFTPDPNIEEFKTFTMTEPIFSLVTPTLSENSIVDKVEEKQDKVVLYLKKTKTGLDTLNLRFQFNTDYDGKIPVDQVIWKNLQAIVKASDGTIIDQTDPVQVKSDTKDGMSCFISKFVPSGDDLYQNKVGIRFGCYNNDRQYWLMDESLPENNKLYLEVPTGSVLSENMQAYFESKEITSEEDPNIPDGYSRYYKTITDDEQTFNYWHYQGNPNMNILQLDTTIELPDTISIGSNVHIKEGMIYKKVNGESKEVSKQVDYIKRAQPDWHFIPCPTHGNANGGYNTTVIQGVGDQEANAYVYAGGWGWYNHSGSMKNDGKKPIKNTKMFLRQPADDSKKINFKDIHVKSSNASDAEQGYAKVELEVKNALTGESKIVDGGTGKDFSVTLPVLEDNEYINTVIVTPMGTDGKTEGDFAPQNSLSIYYLAKSWPDNKWPDGTDIPLNQVSAVNMSWDMEYLDESESNSPKMTTYKGNVYPIYYIPAEATQAKASFISGNAANRKPGEYVDYKIEGYNQINATSDYVNPEICVSVPKVLELQNPNTLKTFVDEKNNKEYKDAVKVTLVSSDDTYNYYKFNVTGTAVKNDKALSFSIPLKFKVKEGTAAGNYEIPYVTVSNTAHEFIQFNVPTNNLDDSVAKAFGYDNAKESSYSGFKGGNTTLSILSLTSIDGSSSARKNNTNDWSNLTNFAVDKGGTPQMKASISNVGNSTFESVRLYNILPSSEDGRGSTGNIVFTGLENVSGATIYYTTKPISELPAYENTKIQDWDSAKLQELGFSAQTPEDLSKVTAIFIDLGGNQILPGASMDAILNFEVPNKGNQKAVNQFIYSAKEVGTGDTLNAASNKITFSTEVAQINFAENLPAFLPGEIHAENMPAVQTALLDENRNGTITLSDKKPTLSGYEFVNWEDENGKKYNPGEKITFTNDIKDSTIDLKAIWKAKKIGVIYNENYGTTPKSQRVEYTFGDPISFNKVTNPARTGYTFQGWSEQKNATSPDFKENSKINFVNDKTVYAVWKANNYTVKFEANGGTGTMQDQTMTYDVEKPLVKNTFIKEGYTFKGWNVKQTGLKALLGKSATYTDGQIVKNLTDKENGTVTLEAVWEANEYTIHYNPNGGTGTMEDQKLTYDESVNLLKNTFTKEGYTFKGWSDTKDGQVVYADEKQVTNLTSTADGTIELYAVWEINHYDATFDSQGGSTVNTQTVNYNENLTKPQDPTRAGYTFAGWYKDNKFQNAWNFDTDKMPAKNITLYAKWNLNASELNHVPTITAENVTLTVGDKFDPLKGVTATDHEDGDKVKLEVIKNNVDTKKAG
ncbi:MAG: InlB B-repeat-containing protein, partial [Bacillota bacterium]|nr:InlB B-repeat-containing protein [Bacillota bacterium]